MFFCFMDILNSERKQCNLMNGGIKGVSSAVNRQGGMGPHHLDWNGKNG